MPHPSGDNAATIVHAVPIRRADHVNAETVRWEQSVAFWEGLGFSPVETWGDSGHRAGPPVASEAVVVLAEAPTDPAPFTVFFAAGDLGSGPLPGVDVANPLEDTHWGTRGMRVRDPDGRVHALEEPS